MKQNKVQKIVSDAEAKSGQSIFCHRIDLYFVAANMLQIPIKTYAKHSRSHANDVTKVGLM